MKPVRFGYEPTICVLLSREDVRTLRTVCERHYDAAVRALSIPGRGAILNGANTMLLDNKLTEVEVPFTYRQLDTLAKGLEGAENPDEARMYLKARWMMAALSREADRINRAPEATPSEEWWAERMGGP